MSSSNTHSERTKPAARWVYMMTSMECLAKADQFDAMGYHCDTQLGREGYARLGIRWRETAALARQQEAWAAAHPGF